MTKPLIKICGITCPELAAQTAQLGADYIGLVFAEKSPRYLSDHQLAKDIVQAAAEHNTKVVAVFANTSSHTVSATCSELNISIAQLHGKDTINTAHELPSAIDKIIALPVDQQLQLTQAEAALNLNRDFMLLDNPLPGSGERFNDEYFQRPGVRFFIAGGLAPNNIKAVIQQFQPDGVDVSSGVETQPGKKSLDLIQQFIEEVNSL